MRAGRSKGLDVSMRVSCKPRLIAVVSNNEPDRGSNGHTCIDGSYMAYLVAYARKEKLGKL